MVLILFKFQSGWVVEKNWLMNRWWKFKNTMSLLNLLMFLGAGQLTTAVTLTGSTHMRLCKMISARYLTLDHKDLHFSGLRHRLWLPKILSISATACLFSTPSFLYAMILFRHNSVSLSILPRRISGINHCNYLGFSIQSKRGFQRG